jgi:ketosteroid isomerase-like protein
VSEENLALVLEAFGAYLQGDEAPLYALASPEIVVTQFPDQLDVSDFHGHDGMRRMMAGWLGMWEDWTIEPLSFSAEGDVVVVNAMQRGRGKASGAPMESPVTFVFTLREGAVVRWQMFHAEEEARAALGG